MSKAATPNTIHRKSELISRLSSVLFWDTDIKTIDYKKNAPYVVARVLSLGTMEDFQILKQIYGKPEIKKIAMQLRYMDDRVLHFCSAYFNIPITEFRCYTMKQLNPSRWNY